MNKSIKVFFCVMGAGGLLLSQLASAQTSKTLVARPAPAVSTHYFIPPPPAKNKTMPVGDLTGAVQATPDGFPGSYCT